MTGWRWFKWLGVVAIVAALGLGAAVAVAADANPFSGGSNSGSTPQDDPQDDDGERPWLGIFALPSHDVDGVAISWVAKDGPADQAGLERGDVITAVDGEPVTRLRELRSALDDKSAGDTVTLTVVEGGAENAAADPNSVEVTLGTRPSREDAWEWFKEHREEFRSELGEALEGLRERMEEKRDELRERLQQRFDRFLGGEFSFLDDEGETVTVTIDAGEVKSVSDTELTVTLNGGEEKTYTIGEESRLPDDLAQGDRVIAVSVNGELKAVLGTGGLSLFRTMGRSWSFDGLGHFLFPTLEEEAPEP